MWIEFEFHEQRSLIDVDSLGLFTITELDDCFSLETCPKFYDYDGTIVLTVGSKLWCDQQLDRIMNTLIDRQKEEVILIFKPKEPTAPPVE